jgi:hypothetical protein
VGKFISIGGMSHRGDRNRERPIHPGAEAYYAGRSSTSHDATGFTPGDEIHVQGEHGIVLHEEHDPRSGETITWARANSQTDSGTFMVRWAPDRQRSMVIRDVRKTRD